MGSYGLLGKQNLYPDCCGKPLEGTGQGRGTISKDLYFQTGRKGRRDCSECPRKGRGLRPELEDHGAGRQKDAGGKTRLRGGCQQHMGRPYLECLACQQVLVTAVRHLHLNPGLISQ